MTPTHDPMPHGDDPRPLNPPLIGWRYTPTSTHAHAASPPHPPTISATLQATLDDMAATLEAMLTIMQRMHDKLAHPTPPPNDATQCPACGQQGGAVETTRMGDEHGRMVCLGCGHEWVTTP